MHLIGFLLLQHRPDPGLHPGRGHLPGQPHPCGRPAPGTGPAPGAYANKLASIGRLASGVAHEINNPLAIINQKTGLIKDLFTMNRDYAGNEKLMGLVDNVLESVRRCGTITRRLLDFARHMESSIETVDIEAIIRQVLAFMEKEAERRCIAVSVAIQGDDSAR
jgi:two-component system NtrC family sensor kinase